MSKIIKLYCQITKFIGLMLSGLIFILVLLSGALLKNRFKEINHIKPSIYFICIIFVFFITILSQKNVIQYYKRKYQDILMWTAVLPKEEFVFYFCCCFPWICINALILWIASLFCMEHTMLLWIVFMVLYLLSFIYNSFNIKLLSYAKKSSRIALTWIKNSYLDMLFITINKKLRNVQVIIIGIIVYMLCLGSILLHLDNMAVYYFIFIIFLIIVAEEIYWDREMKSFYFYKNQGILFEKYFFTECICSICIWGIPLLVGCIYSMPLIDAIIILCAFALIIIYWNNTNIYLGQFYEKYLVLRNIFSVVLFFMMIFPIVNILICLYILQKNRRKWI